ncbi:MAG: hypothetical protein HY606_12560 [Planctomycetes bacterium]|nr:hypothetical protein [Planctomycetota bacterium]
MNKEQAIEKLLNIKRDEAHFKGGAPHKPLLLLVLFSLINKGGTENNFEINNELKALFISDLSYLPS